MHVLADYIVIIIVNTFIKDGSKRLQLISSIISCCIAHCGDINGML